ncbi:immunoglobulin domain-containing protein [Marinifilum sp. RC60d5]|uniref:immunoglobulin domain-containing protein n=1 Tax=Marinifilum sp. RC60d5 TaxID=3458414 RepID=UPI0040356746
MNDFYNIMNLNDMGNGKNFTRFQNFLKVVFVFILFALPIKSIAQYDYEHYVPPFYCSAQVGKQEIFLSTNSEKELTVYVEDGQGKSIAGPFTISRTKSETYIFETSSGATYSTHSNSSYPDGCSYSYGIIGPKELNKPLDGHGLRIYSYDGPFFANIRHGFSNDGDGGALTHGFSLSAKGATAQGTDFYSGHLYNHTILHNTNSYYSDPYYYGRYPVRGHSISVMAVEEGSTTVTFSGLKCKYITKYESGSVKLVPITSDETISVDLTKGQSYTIAVNLYGEEFHNESIEVRNGMNGTHITSSQKIVVNSGSWTAGAKPSQDMGFDQIVPVDQVRDKYIVMKGLGRAEPDPGAYYAGQERTIVVATQENTEVWVNEVNKGTLANPGDFMILDDIVNPSALPTLYINTKGKDVYVYQTMCGTSGNYINIGLNFIPPLTVLGMKEVVIPKAKQITSGDYIYPTVTILAQKNVDVEFNGNPVPNPHDVTGTTEWVYFKVSEDILGDCRFAGNKAINVAWTASSNTLGAAGYYSGFTKAVSPIHPEIDVDTDLGVICESYDDNIVVSVKEPEPDFYEWYINNFEGDAKFPNSPLDVEAPDVETSYYVIGYYRDPSLDILFNGDFLDGYNGFNSEYELVTKNLTEPGKFAITGRPKDENALLNDFPPLSGWKMFLGYSDNQGDVVYQVDELEVESEFNYIFKMYGRLAQDESANDQSLRVLVNDETIITDFTINSSNEWQSSSALWSPGDARKASIKILNNNLDSQDAFFAIDSISFVQAVQDTAVFVAKVVPNISTIKDTEYHFCEGTPNSLDVSNGETSWYDYSWSKKDDETGEYIKLVNTDDIFGVDSCVLTFNDPKQIEEGTYRCTIGFNEDYQRCGPDETLDVDLEVFVDLDANVRISGASHTCMNSPVTFQALVEGDQEILKWYVDGADEPVYVSKDKEYSFPAETQGMHTIRCEAENGCGLSFAEVQIEVLAYPKLTALNVADHTCVGADVSLEALATVEGTSNLKYYWYKGVESLDHNESTYSFTSSLDDQGDVYSVAVSNTYTVGDDIFECRSEQTLETDPLNIIPEVNLTPLSDATLCEGEFHEFKAEVGEDESNYEFKWKINNVLTDNKTSAYAISSVSNSDVGAYKVVVWNECFTEKSTANLAIKPKIKVYGIDFNADGPFCTATNVSYTFNVEDNGAAYEYKIIDPKGNETITTQTGTFLVDESTQGEWQFIVNGECGEDPFVYKQSFWLIPDFGNLTIDDVGTCLGENINFYAKVDLDSDLSELTYLWKNSAGTELGTEATLPINNVQESDLGTYSCTVSDGCHEKTESAVLSIEKVNTNPDLAEITLCVGESLEIAIDYVGTPEFEWRFNDPSGSIINSTNTFKIPSVSKTDEGIYYCKVKLICGTSVTVKRKLIVNEHINVADVSDLTIDICQGDKPELTINVTGETDNYSVLWTDGADTPLDGFGDVNTIQLPAHNTVGSFTYKAIVDGNCEDFEKKYIVQVHEKPILKAVDNDMLKCSGLVELNITESGEHNGISWWKNGSEIFDGNSEPTDFVINPATSPDDDGTYIAKVSSKYCGPAQSSIKLDIINTIELKEQSPALTEVCESNNVTLFVKADGDDIQYKWTHTADPSKTFPNSPSIELKDVTSAKDEGEYTCELSNDLGCGNTTATFNVIVNENPSISHPEDQTICETTTSVDFKVKGSAEGDENYQWYKNGVLIPGATSRIYTENSPANGSTYYCTVTGTIGDCGTAKSNEATLTIIKEVSVTDPIDQYIADGADATFNVKASGEPEYSYQWQVWNGTDWFDISDVDKYSGTKTTELKITNADKATYDGKQYRCVVLSSGKVCNSSATSNEATLHINTVVKIAAQPENQTVCEGENAIFEITGKISDLTYTWEYSTDGVNFNSISGESSLSESSDANGSELTISPAALAMNSWSFRCLVSDGSSTDEYSNEVSVRVLKDIDVSTANASFNPCLNKNFSLSVEATGDDIKFQWYKDDVIITGATKATYNFGNIALADEATYKCEVYNDQHCNDITRTFIVDVKVPATVDDPENVVMCETDIDPKFTVTGGGYDISYQWYKNNVAISGAESASYTETDPKDGNTYYCEVSNTCTTVKSKSALLSVVKNLETTDPDNLTIADGANATFTVIASGEPNYTYQWQVWNGSDWDNISDIDKYSGTSTAELTITNADKATYDGKQYRCVVYSDGGICISEVTSGKATLTINTVVKIAADANNAEVCFGDDASLTLTGTSDALAFTWEYNKGGSWIAADGQDGMSANKVGAVSTLTVPGTDLGINTWQFRCLVSDASSTDVYSNTVTVRVLEDIVVSTIDENFTPCLNDAFALSVVTTAGDDIKFQWYKDDVIITGATKATYNFGNIAFADEATYKCKVYNDEHCNDITRTFIVDVKEPATVNDPVSVVMCETDVDPKFTVTGGGDGISYQWYKNNVAISGATSASYTETDPKDGNTYSCEVSNTCTTVKSKSAVLTVVKNLETTDPKNLTIADGANATFSVVASGEPNYTYQWQVWNGSDWDNISDIDKYSGTQTAELTITNADKATYDGKQYQCVVYSDGGICISEVTSGIATLTITAVDKILNQPKGNEVCNGEPTKITIEGTVVGHTYIWEYDEGDGSGYKPAVGNYSMISSETGKISTLSIPNASLAMNSWLFRCVVNPVVGSSETSQPTTIRVLQNITASAVNADQSVCENESVTMAVTATGDDKLYKWYKDSEPLIILSKSEELSIHNVQPITNEGAYTCEVYNTLGCGDQTVHFTIDVKELVAVTNPFDKIICETDEAPMFTVSGSGEPGFTYQWYDKNGVLAGETSDSYTAVSKENGQSYYCKVVGACNTANSNVAKLSVVKNLETTDPKNLTIADGANATFTVVASGEPNYTYQWQVWNGSDWDNISDIDKYSGTQTAELTITNADKATYDGKQYRCVVYSDGGICISEVTSGKATLTINTVVKIAADASNAEVCFGDDASLTVTGTSDALAFTWEYNKGGSWIAADGQDGMSANKVGAVSTLTVPGTDLDINTWQFRCLVSDASSTDVYSNTVTVRVLEDIAASAVLANQSICENESVTMEVTATGDDKLYKWYKDSEPLAILSTASSYRIDNVQPTINEGDYTCEVYNLRGCNDQTVHFTIDVKEFVAISDLSDIKMCPSQPDPVFKVKVSGDTPYGFQWYNSAGAISGATSDTYTETNPVDGETYYCELTNDCNTITSNTAILTVYEEAKYTSQPISISILDGDDAEFNVEAAGEEPLSYQWQEDSGSGYVDITDDATYSGSNTANLKITKANLTFNGNKYRCLLSNICNTDLASAEVDLQVLPLYKILTQPANLQACLNDEVSFEIVGTDTDTPYDYEWEYNDGSGTFVNAEGVLGMEEVLITNGSQLKISSVSLDMRNWTFHCIVKDGISENDTSNEVAIEVFEPVSFDLIDDQNLCAEESMQISLSGLTGTTPISYSWTKDATEVSTTAIVTIGEADNGNYEVTAGNGVCPDFTDDFVVSHYSKLSIEAWSNTDQLCIGEEETLTATVNVDPALAAGTSYEWFKDEISLGVTTADYKLTATSKDQSGMYKLVVFDGCNTETVSGYIDIYEPIKKVDDWLSKETLCVGQELSLEVNVSGDAVDYTWTKDGDPITATTNYLVTKVTTDDAGTYKCVVTDHCGIELTYTIEITILSIPEIADGIEDLPAICEGDALQLGPINIKGTYGAITWTLNDASEDTSSGLSLILGAATSDMEGNYKVAVTNICGTVASIGTQVVNPIPAMEPIADQTVCQGEDVIFSAKATGRDVHYHWKIDGEDQATSLSVLLINGMNVLPADEFTQRIYTIECSVTNDNGCGETLVETAQLIVNPTTILKETLKDVVKYVGDDYTMSLDVTGTDLSYEWTHEKTDGTIEVLGVDAPTIEFTNIDLSDAGYYSCIITGTCGTRIASGTLTVKVPVKIVEDLSAFEEKCEGDALRLLIVTSGQVEAIKWFKEVGDTRTELTETGSSLYFSELSLDDAATYTCEITGEGIDVIKQSCIVRVYPTTRLNAPIGNKELCEGKMLDWSPDVTGAADLSYTWSFEGNPVSTDKNLHYDVLDLLQEGEYQVQVTGLCGDVSSSGYLEITELPEIISVSENAEVCENFALVEFIVKATGENVKYQWRKNGTDIEGKTSPILSLTSIQLDDDAIYTCRVYNDCAEVISADMKLTVKPQLVILSEPADIEVCSGEDVTFTAEVEGIDVTYQWQVNGVDIPGETNSVYSITNTDESHNGYYTCVVSDECTSSRSTKPAKLTVNALPNTAIFGRMVLCAKEDRVTYITNQYGDDVYGWGVEGGIFAGPEEGTKTRVTWSEAKEGMLSISITDMNTGCESKVDSLVVLNALPTVKLAKYESKGICEESFELSGGYPEGGIYWVDGISEEVFDPADKGPGNYTVHYSYTDENGCSNITETTNLRVDTLPVVDITDDITVGSCKSFELSAKTDEGNISWSPADNLDDAYSMKPIFTPGESQVLVATVVDEHGCKGVDLVEINVAPLPEVTTIADTTVGQCNQLQLSTEIIGDAGEITWTNSDHLDEPDSKDPRIINAPEGTYTYKVNVVDLYGCDASDEVTVKMVADPVLEESKFACEGEKFEVDVTGMQNPFWSNSDWNNEERNEINNLDIYTVKTPGKYKLEVSNEYGCGAVQNFTINPTPKIELSNNLIYDGPDEIEILEDKPVVIFEGQSLTLGTNLPLEYSPYFYTWQDGSILPKFEVSETGKYILRVEDNLGCFAVDSLNIEVKPVGIESPSAFTPNSTNENNRFYLKKINYDFEKYEMYVYDRWGELLYKTNEFGYNGGWDGKYKGKLCPSGAYVWMVFINGELTNKGTFMLLR